MPLFRKNPKVKASDDMQEKAVDVNIALDELDKEIEAVDGKKEEQKKKINWFEDDEEVGQLSVDVYEKSGFVIIKSTVAGVKPEDIEVMVDEDMVTVRGKRRQEEDIQKDNYYYQECYWGSFERSLKLPIEVSEDGAEAYLKNGVLTIKLAKLKKPKSIKVPVRE